MFTTAAFYVVNAQKFRLGFTTAEASPAISGEGFVAKIVMASVSINSSLLLARLAPKSLGFALPALGT